MCFEHIAVFFEVGKVGRLIAASDKLNIGGAIMSITYVTDAVSVSGDPSAVASSTCDSSACDSLSDDRDTSSVADKFDSFSTVDMAASARLSPAESRRRRLEIGRRGADSARRRKKNSIAARARWRRALALCFRQRWRGLVGGGDGEVSSADARTDRRRLAARKNKQRAPHRSTTASCASAARLTTAPDAAVDLRHDAAACETSSRGNIV